MNKNKRVINGTTFTTGDFVQCTIQSTQITDARIYIHNNDNYICQNLKNGSGSPEPLGYTCGWVFQVLMHGNLSDGVRDLIWVEAPCYKPKDPV